MTALSMDIYVTNRMQNFYKKILIPFKHGHQHGKLNELSKCCLIHFTQALMHKVKNTYCTTFMMMHHCYPQITSSISVSLCSPTWGTYDRHVQDIANNQTRLHPRITVNKHQNLITSIERTCIQGFSPTPAKICLYCMVRFTKIPCGCYWESLVLFCLLHSYIMTTILTSVHPPWTNTSIGVP